MSEKFSSEDDELLIDLVRQHPPLYNVAGKGYKDLVVKNNIWKEIGAIMKKTEKACQTRWKNIRDYYQKKKREAVKGLTTGSPRNISVGNFSTKYKHLSFLDNTSIVERRTTSNLSESNDYPNPDSEQLNSIVTESQDVMHESQDVMDESQAAVSDMEDSQTTVNSQASLVTKTVPTTQEPHKDQPVTVEESTVSPNTPSTRKRKPTPKERAAATVVEEIKKGRTERNNLFKQLLNPESNKTKECDSPISTFFRSIALTVEQLPPDLQTRAKVQVMHVISELEFEHQQRSTVDYSFRPVSTGSSYSVISPSSPTSAASYLQGFFPQDNLVESNPPDSPNATYNDL